MFIAFYEDSDKERLVIVKTEPDDVDDDELVIDPSWPMTRIQALASAQYDRTHCRVNNSYDDSDDSFHWLGYPEDDDYGSSIFNRYKNGRY